VTRRIVITVCPRETGVVALPVERGGRLERLDAPALVRHLEAIVVRRGLAGRVRIQAGCAGGCAGPGPNVSLTFHAMPHPGERPDSVALGWKTYVASLGTLACVATIVDENDGAEDGRRRGLSGGVTPARRATRRARRRRA
jgi:hypothetical protein